MATLAVVIQQHYPLLKGKILTNGHKPPLGNTNLIFIYDVVQDEAGSESENGLDEQGVVVRLHQPGNAYRCVGVSVQTVFFRQSV